MNRLGLETPKEDDAGLGCMARLPRADMGMLGWAEMRDQSLVSLVGCAQVGRRRTDLGVDGVDVVQVEGSEGMGPAGWMHFLSSHSLVCCVRGSFALIF